MNHTAVPSGMQGTGKITSIMRLRCSFTDAGADFLFIDCDFTDPSFAADLGIAEPNNLIHVDRDCELFATIPEPDIVMHGAAAVLVSLSATGGESYRELARSMYRPLHNGRDGPVSSSALCLPQPADPLITAAILHGRLGETDTSSNDETGNSGSAAANDETPSGVTLVADGGTTPDDDANDSDADASTTEPDGDQESGTMLTRRSALAAITAAVGGVSAGILKTRETPTIEAFGYGGTPVSSTEPGTTSATNNTTSGGSFPTAGVNRTEPTTGSGDGDSEEDLSENETEPGDLGNTTTPENGSNTTTSENVSNITDPEAEVSTDQEPDGEPTADTSDSTPTSGGSTGNSGTGGGGSDGGTEPDDGSENDDDTTDETSPSKPSDGKFGTVGYGQGGYGGVA